MITDRLNVLDQLKKDIEFELGEAKNGLALAEEYKLIEGVRSYQGSIGAYNKYLKLIGLLELLN